MKNINGSLYALGVIRHDKEDERAALEAAAARFIEDGEQAKWARALQWFENLSFLCGNHLTRFYYGSGGFQTHTFGLDDRSQHDSVIAQVCDNRLVRPFETVIGMLTQAGPKPRVEPNSTSPDDEDAARLSALVVDLTFENPMRMPEIRQDAAAIAMICGSVFGETEYTETDQPMVVPKYKIERDEDGREALVEDGETVEMRRDIATTLWTPFHFDADPRATSDRDAIFFRRSSFEDRYVLGELYDKDEEGFYPEALEGAGGTEVSRYPLYWWSRFQDVLDTPHQYWNGAGFANRRWSQAGVAENQAYTSVIDVKPTRQFPRGRTLVMVNGKLVYCGDARAWSQKYPWRWHGYSAFHWLKMPGRFLGVPLLSQIVPLQKRINAIDALVQANRELMSIGGMKIPRQCRVADGQISGIPGQHIHYTAVPGIPEPHKIEHVPLPGELMAERADLVQAIDVIAASGVIGADMAKSAARAGVIMDFLREERLRSKGPMLKSFEQFLERIGQNTLIEIQLGLVQEDPELTQRIRTAAKRFSSIQIDNFTGASLRDHHAVKIDITSELVDTKEARKQRAVELIQFLAGSLDPEQITILLKEAGFENMAPSEQNVSVERARRMIARIEAGEFTPVKIQENSMPEVIASQLGIMPGIDEPMVMAPVFKKYMQTEQFHDLDRDAKQHMIDLYRVVSLLAQQQAAQMMQAKLAMEQAGGTQAA